MRSHFGTCAPGSIVHSALVFLVILTAIPSGRCQTGEAIDDGGMNQLFARPFYNELQTLTGTYSDQIGHKLDYCIQDRCFSWNHFQWIFTVPLIFDQFFSFVLAVVDIHKWYISLSGDFCRDADWNDAFNFSSNLTFLTECFKQTSMLPFFFNLLVFPLPKNNLIHHQFIILLDLDIVWWFDFKTFWIYPPFINRWHC